MVAGTTPDPKRNLESAKQEMIEALMTIPDPNRMGYLAEKAIKSATTMKDLEKLAMEIVVGMPSPRERR